MKVDPLGSLLKSILAVYVGNSAIGVVELLHGKKNVNEFLISKKLKMTINQTRNILYKLSDEGMVSFIRKKDSKKGGWYTYFWTLNVERCLAKFKEGLNSRVETLKRQRDDKKSSSFYKCKNCGLEFNEENALNNNYTCLECGEVLEIKNMDEEIAEIDKNIAKTEGLMTRADSELSLIREEDEKIKIRRMKTEERKKKKEREVKRKARAREKARNSKKSVLKKIKLRKKGKKK